MSKHADPSQQTAPQLPQKKPRAAFLGLAFPLPTWQRNLAVLWIGELTASQGITAAFLGASAMYGLATVVVALVVPTRDRQVKSAPSP